MLRVIVFCAMLLIGGTPLRAEVTQVDSAGLQSLLSSGVPVVDIRTPEEWRKTGVIGGSHLLTFFDAKGRYDVGRWLTALAAIADAGRPVAILCHSGTRSNIVTRFLDQQFGYRHVYNVRHGISRWIAEGRPVVRRR